MAVEPKRCGDRRQARPALLCDVAFISGLMAQKVPFIVTELGPDVDTLCSHIYAAVAEKGRSHIAERTRAALQAAKVRGA